MAVSNYAVTVALSDEDRELLEAFADEHGIDDLGEALRTLLHEYIAVSDALWEEQFAHSGEALDRLAAQVEEEIAAGRVEIFDPDAIPDSILKYTLK